MKRVIYKNCYECELKGFKDSNTAHIVMDAFDGSHRYVPISELSDIRIAHGWDFSNGSLVVAMLPDAVMLQINPDKLVCVSMDEFKVMRTSYRIVTIESTKYLVDLHYNNKVNLIVNPVEVAVAMLLSLRNCINCTDCYNCFFCEGCLCCTDCKHCNNCSDCSSSTWCSNAAHETNASNVESQFVKQYVSTKQIIKGE